jgi:signal transduction histidine kinase
MGPFMGPPPDHGQMGPMAPHTDPVTGSTVGPRTIWAKAGTHIPIPKEQAIDVNAATQALQGRAQYTDVTIDGSPYRVYTEPIRSADHKIQAVIQFPAPLGDYIKSLASLRRTLLIVLPGALILVAVASLFIVDRAIRPVKTITTSASNIGADRLETRLPVIGNDEFADLATTMNEMLDRIEGAFTLQTEAMQRLEEILLQQRRFTADASHELKTPLSVIKVHAGMIKSQPGVDPQVIESSSAINEAASRMNRLVQDLMLLARTDAGQLMERFEHCDMKAIASAACDLVRDSRRVRLHVFSEDVCLTGSSFALERLIVNLVDNACRHTRDDQLVNVTLRSTGEEIFLEVRDNGDGIAPEHLPHIFERFYRADAARSTATGGSGLGLAICKGIVEAHGGTIHLESELGKGTTVFVSLPTHLNAGNAHQVA